MSEAAPSGLPGGRERKLPVAEAVSKTWQTFRARPWPFVGLALLPIPISLFSSMFGAVAGATGNDAFIIVILILVNALQFGVQLACQGAAVYGGVRILSGTTFTLGEAFGVGFRRLLPVIGMGLLAGLIIVIGLALFVIPGLIAAAAFAVALPACLIEKQGPVAALKRSLVLSKGNRWRIIGAVLLAVMLPFFAVFFLLALLYGILAAVHLQFLALLLLPILLIAILAVAGASPIILSVIYVELRSIKEGLAPRETVVGVFD